MVEWWTRAHALMETYGLRKEHVAAMVSSPGALVLRDGAKDLLAAAHAHRVPFHVFSAGIRDVITGFFFHVGADDYKPHVLGNEMAWSEEGALTGFHPPLVHSLNKDGSALRQAKSWHHVSERRNVLLLGDNLNDACMADGLELDTCVRVGFLNDRIEERRDQYSRAFDVVIEGDPAEMTYVLELFDRLRGGGEGEGEGESGSGSGGAGDEKKDPVSSTAATTITTEATAAEAADAAAAATAGDSTCT